MKFNFQTRTNIIFLCITPQIQNQINLFLQIMNVFNLHLHLPKRDSK